MKVKKVFPRVTRGDMLIIAAVLFSALLLFVFQLTGTGGGGRYVGIIHGGGGEYYPLTVDRTVELESRGCRVVIEISDGGARFLSSDCPDGLCIGMGRICAPGQTAVCLPAGVLIKITGGGETDADWIAG